MSVVTLTSDLSTTDHYVAVMKGLILQRMPQAAIVDITHGIKAFDIVQAAYALRHAYAYFPKGSVHVVSVYDYAESSPRILAFTKKGHFFVGPDNGLFSLIFGNMPKAVRSLQLKGKDPLEAMRLYSHAATHLALQQPLTGLGRPAAEVITRIQPQPVVNALHIRGSIVHVDHFGNAITNISDSLFKEKLGEGSFALYFKRHDPITSLCQHYTDVQVGEVLCLFNSAGYLEIAIHAGRAADLLSLKVDDMVQIEPM